MKMIMDVYNELERDFYGIDHAGDIAVFYCYEGTLREQWVRIYKRRYALQAPETGGSYCRYWLASQFRVLSPEEVTLEFL